MGPISMLHFVSTLAPSKRAARSALDAFLKEGTALLMVDPEQMDAIFTPKRRIWAGSASPLIADSDRTLSATRNEQIMIDAKTFSARLAQVEEVVAKLDAAAQSGDQAPKFHTQLRQMAAKIHLPSYADQSKNNLFMNLGEPKVDTVDDNWKAPSSVTHPKTASLETLQANEALASGILNKVEETATKIDQLVTAGRKFNASRAKSDVFAVASRVAEVLNSTDLAQPWVTDELSTISAEADRLHGLFAPAKV